MILSRADYLASIESLLPDNSTQLISPLKLRTSLINLVDSVPYFLAGTSLNTSNFATPETRTTKAGDMALSSMFLAGRSSTDNSAFGYSALKSNYNGPFNTAIGSHALSCNLYGGGNSALGYQSLVGNVTGSGNVGIGSYTLHNNKHGSYNIAIGHGAGWYLGPDVNYRFIVSSSPIESGLFCDNDNPVYSGDPPLLYGNLQNGQHKLAIGTDQLHNFGMLQVGGDASPSLPNQFHLGRTQYSWLSLNQVINFSGGHVGIGGSPVESKRLAIYGDVIISGNLLVDDIVYNNISQCLYECKTIHLATSGVCDPEGDGFHNDAVCGYLNDQGLDGAGFEIHSSGTDYRRDYRFVYRPPDSTPLCLPITNAFTKSRWESNISLELLAGASLISERILGRDNVSMVLNSGCMGVFIAPTSPSGQRVLVGQKPHFVNNYETLEDVNFISRSGTDVISGNPSGYDYSVMYGTVDSGVKVIQRFASRIRSASTARGFSIVYHDELDIGIGGCDGYSPDVNYIYTPCCPEVPDRLEIFFSGGENEGLYVFLYDPNLDAWVNNDLSFTMLLQCIDLQWYLIIDDESFPIDNVICNPSAGSGGTRFGFTLELPEDNRFGWWIIECILLGDGTFVMVLKPSPWGGTPGGGGGEGGGDEGGGDGGGDEGGGGGGDEGGGGGGSGPPTPDPF